MVRDISSLCHHGVTTFGAHTKNSRYWETFALTKSNPKRCLFLVPRPHHKTFPREFESHENELVGRTHFPMNGFVRFDTGKNQLVSGLL